MGPRIKRAKMSMLGDTATFGIASSPTFVLSVLTGLSFHPTLTTAQLGNWRNLITFPITGFFLIIFPVIYILFLL